MSSRKHLAGAFWKTAATLFGVGVVMAACSQQKRLGDVTICTRGSCNAAQPLDARPKSTATPSPTATPAPVPPVDDKTAFLMLKENCTGCHGVGRDKRSYWPMPSEFDLPRVAEAEAAKLDLTTTETFESLLNNTVKLEKLVNRMEADQFSVEVFQTIENNLTGSEKALPRAMRPAMDPSVRKRFVELMNQLIAAKDAEDAASKKIGATSSTAVLSLNEARSWCSGCHTPGGSGDKVWRLANGGLKEWKDFAAIAKSSVEAGRMPYARPTGSDRDNWLGLAAWFQKRMPLVVAEARGKYHGQQLNLGLPVDYQYQCSAVTTSRQFLNRITADALGRPPTPAEVALLQEPDKPVTQAVRKQMVDRLANEWKAEFISYGFKVFAEKVAASGKVRNSLVIADADVREDVAGEFYQLVKSESQQNKSYKEILLSKKVFVTAKTAKYYNKTCENAVAMLPAGQKYAECRMDADGSPRSNFFTTLGFLASKSSSMFIENNNYGRVAAMNEVIRGEPLLANTRGEEGETIDPLPTCMVTSDWRVVTQDGAYAPRGTATVPASGNFCQGCHIRRNLAAGAIAFRPFGPMGELLTYTRIDELNRTTTGLSPQDNILRNQIQDAIGPNWGILRPNTEFAPIGLSTFANFLNIGVQGAQERGCIVDPLLPEPKTVTAVGDLVDHALSDELVLARGLSRIVPRALSNLNATNTEVIKAVTSAWTASNGQLMAIFQAYFLTDTYACSSTGGK